MRFIKSFIDGYVEYPWLVYMFLQNNSLNNPNSKHEEFKVSE